MLENAVTEGATVNSVNIMVFDYYTAHEGVPGPVDSNTCSGITQNTWDFSHILKPFTS